MAFPTITHPRAVYHARVAAVYPLRHRRGPQRGDPAGVAVSVKAVQDATGQEYAAEAYLTAPMAFANLTLQRGDLIRFEAIRKTSTHGETSWQYWHRIAHVELIERP